MTDMERQDRLHVYLHHGDGCTLATLWAELSRLARLAPDSYGWVPGSHQELQSDLQALAIRGLAEKSGQIWLRIVKPARKEAMQTESFA